MIRALLAAAALVGIFIGGLSVWFPMADEILLSPPGALIVALFTLGPSLLSGQAAAWMAALRADAEDRHRWKDLRAVIDEARHRARIGGIVGLLIGIAFAARAFNEPPEVLLHLCIASLAPLMYGLLVSELVLAPISARLCSGDS